MIDNIAQFVDQQLVVVTSGSAQCAELFCIFDEVFVCQSCVREQHCDFLLRTFLFIPLSINRLKFVNKVVPGPNVLFVSQLGVV